VTLRITGTRWALAHTATTALLAAGCGQAPSSDGGAGGAPASAAVDNPALGRVEAATGSTVKIGLFNGEGTALANSPQVGDSAVAAAQYANDHLGGLGGHRIEIERCADKSDPAVARACAEQFVRDGVAAVVVGQPATADAIVPTIVGAGIPWVGSTPIAASETSSPDTFFFGAGFVGTLGGWAQYAKDVGYRNIALFGVDSPVFTAAIDALGRPLFQRAGISIKLIPLPIAATDATEAVEEALQDKPDAVAVLTDTQACRSLLSALHAASVDEPKLLTSACIDQASIDKVGEAAVDNAVVFNVGDPTGDHPEAQLYRAVMQQYAPSVEPGGTTLTGYLAMLGLVRAVNATGLPDSDAVAPGDVLKALRDARDIPRPVGDSGTFSCDRSAMSTPALKATICTDELMYTTYTGGLPGRYGKIEVGSIVNS
jgi:branched-chain amino acid transport system substrate-binding protein